MGSQAKVPDRSIGSLVRIDSGDDEDEVEMNKDPTKSATDDQQVDDFQSQMEKGSLRLSRGQSHKEISE